MNKFQKTNKILGWLAFFIALATYTITMEKTGSLWDCGEFLSCTYKLQVAHPPGAPFYMMVGKMFSLLAMGNTANVAMMINFFSAVTSAFCVLFFFWSSVILMKLVFLKDEDNITSPKANIVLYGSFLAALAATFLDSMWFNALEGEVYSFSIFFTTFNVWAILKWYDDKSENADFWLLMIAACTGMSIGVHLLSLLAFPFIGILIYYKKFNPSRFGGLIAFGASVVMMFFVMKVELSMTSSFLGKMDLLFVNTMGLPFYSGSIVGTILIIALFYYLIRKSSTNRNFLKWNESKFKFPLNTVVLIIAFLFMGYLSNYIVVIRANANPPINMNVPNNFLTLKSYLDREQYGDRPLVSGPYYTEIGEIEAIEDKSELYFKNDATGRYEMVGHNKGYIYPSQVKKFFPRLGHEGDDKKGFYRMWINPEYDVIDRASGNVVQTFGKGKAEEAEQFANQQNMNGQAGQFVVKDKLTFFDNIKYFVQYQIGFMYFRYLMWNTSGRTDDNQGRANNDNGRWQTGIGFVDNLLGSFWGNASMDQAGKPSILTKNKANNSFYMIPFLLCILGMYYSFKKDKQIFWAMLALFFSMGIMQLIQSNEPPVEPRERDYAIAPSFWAFVLWMPFGAMFLYEFLKDKLKSMPATVVALLVTAIAPLLMGVNGWDDHNRGTRTSTLDFAENMLNSCPPNAILFTYGDNDTYPLWYAQEIVGVRPDIRVVNTSLIEGDAYIGQLRLPMNNSASINLNMPQDRILGESRNYFRFSPNPLSTDTLSVNQLISFLMNDDPRTMVTYQNGISENFVPTTHISLDIDRDKAIKSNFLISKDKIDFIPNKITFEIPGSISRGTLVQLDIIANNLYTRPVCFATSNPSVNNIGLRNYMQLEGMVYMFSPTGNPSPSGLDAINAERVSKLIRNYKFGNISKDILLDEHTVLSYNNMKQPMVNLAMHYAFNNNLDSVKSILRFMYKNIPADKLAYNYIDIGALQAALIAQDTEMATRLKEGIFNNSIAELDWATKGANKSNVSVYQDEVRMNLSTLNNMRDILSRAGDSTFVKKIDDKFGIYETALSVRLK